MARPVFGRVSAGRSGAADRSARVAHLDRDRPLVEAAPRDPASFDALYRRYLAQVYSYAYYELGDHHEAEDATERTFLAALANLGRFEERGPADGEAPRRSGSGSSRSPATWSPTSAAAGAATRRRRSRPPRWSPTRSTSEGGAHRDEAAAAWRAVGRLPADRRRALVLRFVDEMSTAEIAGVLGRSEGAVRVLIHRALRTVARDSSAGPRRSRRQGPMIRTRRLGT